MDLKATDCDLHWNLLRKENGISLEYLRGEKNVLSDILSSLDIDELTIQKGEELAILLGSESSDI
jgi:hypothetical protein